MAEVASAYVSLIPETKGFGSKLDSQVGGDVQKSGKSLGSKFGSVFKVGALAALGGAAVLGGFLKGSLEEAREAQKVGALTNAVIKSTGGVANVTAKDVDSLASSLSTKIGVDDEAIAAGENMLLTFSKVRNEVGKGNNIFDRATVTANDMAAAFGGDAVSNSKMLGKALNDPTKGVSALTRVGVSFTEQQKKQIERLQESGDILGAQKVILGEVSKQTKGAAESQATNADKVKVAWGNVQEQIGEQLLPIVDKFLGFVLKHMPQITAVIGNIGPAFKKVKGFIQPVIDTVKRVFDIFSSGGGSGGLGKLTSTFQSVFDNVKSIVKSAVDILKSLWRAFGGTIIRYAKATFDNVLQVIKGAFDVIAGIFKVVSSLLKGDWKGVWDGIKQIVRGAWNVIKGIVKQGWNIIKAVFSILGTVLRGIWNRTWDGIKTLTSKAIGALVGFFRSIGGKITGALSSLRGKLADLFSNAMDAAKDKVVGIGGTIVGWIQAIPGKLASIGGRFADAGRGLLQKFIDGMKNAAGIISGIAGNVWDTVKGLLNSAINQINDALSFTINTPGPDIHVDAPNIPTLASGGVATRGTLAIIGEGREDEAVLPLSKLSAMLDRERMAGAGGAGGRAVFHIYDRDDVLLGTMEGVADGRIHGATQLAGETARAM